MAAGKSFDDYLRDAVSGELHAPKCMRNKNLKPISPDEGSLIETYVHQEGDRGITPTTQRLIATVLVMFARRSEQSFKDLTTEEALRVINQLRKESKPNSLRRMLPLLKTFFKWLTSTNQNTTLDYTRIASIKSPALDMEVRKASQMLKGEDIKKLLAHAVEPRDRAMLAMLFEGSLRPIEVALAEWEDLNFDKYGAQFSTSKKTGKSRYIRLIMSAPHLIEWSNRYPGNPEGSNPVFPQLHLQNKKLAPLSPSGVNQIVKKVAKAAGLEKHIHAYVFRHSRITCMLREEIPESVIKLQGWGDINTRSLGHYAHMENSDIDRILLSRSGITTIEKKESEFKVLQCSVCGTITNDVSARYCSQCRSPLTEEEKASLEKDEQTAVKSKEYEELKAMIEEMRKNWVPKGINNGGN